MEKERRIRTLNLVALIVAVLGLTIAFAALSRTLTINGTASVDAASWDVRFIDLGEPEIVGDAKEISSPSISEDGTKIEGINVSLTKPGDMISYSFNVINNGTINAKFEKFLMNGEDSSTLSSSDIPDVLLEKLFPTCDWDGDGTTTNEERKHCSKNISYMPTTIFQEGDVIEPGKTLASYNELMNKDVSKIVITYLDVSELPKGEVEMSIDFQMIFVQSN